MNRDLRETLQKFMPDRSRASHLRPMTSDERPGLVYAWKPLNDKAFTDAWGGETVCYTWHTSRRSGASISAEKDLAGRC
jgi:hypothetical protein